MKIRDFDSVIFDIDGTLWDATVSIYHSWCSCLEARYPKLPRPSYETVRSLMGFTIEQIADTLFPDYEGNRVDVTLDCMAFEVEHLYNEPGFLYSGVYDTIKTLSESIKICIVSNCPDGYIQAMLSMSGLGEFVTDYECIGRTGLSKVENIRLVMQRSGCTSAVYVGDMDSDREAAAATGIPFIHALWGFGKSIPGETELEKITELLDL